MPASKSAPVRKSTSTKSRPAPKPKAKPKTSASRNLRTSSAPKSSAPKPATPRAESKATAEVAKPASSDNSAVSSEAKGTNGDDKLKPEGQMPNLIEAYGGNDQIWMRGSGTSQVNAGAGDDLIGVDGKDYESGTHNTKIDGGEGDDTVFAGSHFQNRNYHVTDENGKTVAKNGEGGDQIQISNVESVHAKTNTSGTSGNDQITSDLQTGDTGIRVHEQHTIFSGKGDDQIQVNTGDNGSSEVKVWPGEGNNQLQVNGGAGSDNVSYISERDGDNPNAEGSDQVRLDGGEGWDQASITSQNYRVVGADGKVISEMGDGRDQISVENFERLSIHNGRGDNGWETFDF